MVTNKTTAKESRRSRLRPLTLLCGANDCAGTVAPLSSCTAQQSKVATATNSSPTSEEHGQMKLTSEGGQIVEEKKMGLKEDAKGFPR